MIQWFSSAKSNDVAFLRDHRGKHIGTKTEKGGYTALMIAARHGAVGAVEFLVDEEARIVCDNGWSALMFAADAGCFAAVQILAPKEAGMSDNQGMTALMKAAARNHVSIVAHLVGFDAELHKRLARDAGVFVAGVGALLIAAISGSTEAMKVLVSYELGDLDPDTIRNLWPHSSRDGFPSVSAEDCKRTLLMHVQRLHNIQSNPLVTEEPWFGAAVRDDIVYIREHHKDNVKRTNKDDLGRTALMYAIMTGSRRVAQFLHLFEKDVLDADGHGCLDYFQESPFSPLLKGIFNAEETSVERSISEGIRRRLSSEHHMASSANPEGGNPYRLSTVRMELNNVLDAVMDSQSTAESMHGPVSITKERASTFRLSSAFDSQVSATGSIPPDNLTPQSTSTHVANLLLRNSTPSNREPATRQKPSIAIPIPKDLPSKAAQIRTSQSATRTPSRVSRSRSLSAEKVRSTGSGTTTPTPRAAMPTVSKLLNISKPDGPVASVINEDACKTISERTEESGHFDASPFRTLSEYRADDSEASGMVSITRELEGTAKAHSVRKTGVTEEALSNVMQHLLRLDTAINSTEVRYDTICNWFGEIRGLVGKHNEQISGILETQKILLDFMLTERTIRERSQMLSIAEQSIPLATPHTADPTGQVVSLRPEEPSIVRTGTPSFSASNYSFDNRQSTIHMPLPPSSILTEMHINTASSSTPTMSLQGTALLPPLASPTGQDLTPTTDPIPNKLMELVYLLIVTISLMTAFLLVLLTSVPRLSL
ncbi:Ankyrin repeat protein 1 [Giardia muris]|uniref:Ankyrin repeat protein 1 n=1 Tax=Giardia muris TaxID=5742 RepID=A0A4Z1SZY3_GIAMU|nr:Ankyrin repeat protein 1 [Giardia muris]|eukprot:TNJ29018.1 Ankyrin repeat protein 1 [Giardia muris]